MTLSTQIAEIEALAQQLPKLREERAELQRRMNALTAQLQVNDTLVKAGEDAERLLQELSAQAERLCSVKTTLLDSRVSAEPEPAPEPEAVQATEPEAEPAEEPAAPEAVQEEEPAAPEVQPDPKPDPVQATEPEAVQAEEPAAPPVAPAEAPAPAAPLPLNERLLAALAQKPGSTTADLADGFGLSARQVALALSRLRQADKVECTATTPPRWARMEDFHALEQAAPEQVPAAVPEVELAAPEQAQAPEESVNREDLDALKEYLLKEGNRTSNQLHTELRRQGWTETRVSTAITAGLSLGELTVSGTTMTRIGVVRGVRK